YAGIFTIKNIEEALLHPILMIECPRILFPYVRNIISEVTRDGGYPPLLLKPVDFADLYRMRLEQMAAEPKGHA
ncbi:MAG: protein-export chaperone SecB, partial [Alphaproteobacteria bacterium]|nr:protein-export chaperone SecB [Alphaproteobacteria bacterium]